MYLCIFLTTTTAPEMFKTLLGTEIPLVMWSWLYISQKTWDRSILSTPYNCLLTTPSQQWPLLPARWPTNFQFARDWVTFGTEPGQSQANQDGRSAWVPPSQDVTRRETSCHFPQSRSPDCFRSRLTSVSLSLSSGGQSLCLGVFAFVCHPLSQCLMLSQSWLDERIYEWWHYSQETSCAT